MKKLFEIGLWLCAWSIGQVLWAQQLPQFTQHRWNELFYNPAYVGGLPDINIESVFRAQWIGIEGRPITVGIGVHAPIPILSGGVGLNIINDMLGAERHTAVYVLYSYKKRFKGNKLLAIGVEIGAMQKNLDGTRLITPDGSYESGIEHNDNLLPNTNQSGIGFDTGIGLRYQAKQYNIGIAAKHLLSTPISIDNSTINLVPHIIIYGNYRFILSNTIDIEPAILLKTDLNKYQPDITLTAYFGNQWLGAMSVRGIGQWESASATLGMRLGQQWKIAYSYDFPLLSLSNATSGSHELTLHYRINSQYRSKQGKKTYNPRFL